METNKDAMQKVINAVVIDNEDKEVLAQMLIDARKVPRALASLCQEASEHYKGFLEMDETFKAMKATHEAMH